MELYPYQPQSTVPISSIQAICRCSTKKRAVLLPFSISSASPLCAMDESPHLGKCCPIHLDLLSSVRSGWVHGITLIWSPSLIRVPPVTTTDSPGLRPLVTL